MLYVAIRWSYSPFSSTIVNYFSFLLSFLPLNAIPMTTRVTKTLNSKWKFWIILWNLCEKTLGPIPIEIINETTIIYLTTLTTSMSPFSKPLLDFDYIPKFPPFTYIPFFKTCSCIFMKDDYTLKVTMVRIFIFNKSQCK